jgi:hypothetical protein
MCRSTIRAGLDPSMGTWHYAVISDVLKMYHSSNILERQ